MQVIEFKEFGSPSQLKLAERALPQADANTAVVRVEAASVNPSDVKNVAGRMSQTTLPRVPGRDYSGVVVDGPQEWIDKEVWGTGGDVGFTRDGSHAEYIQAPLASLVRKPEALSHEQAACVGVTFVTAWCALEYSKLSKGETFVVFGANGGVGGAAIQIAKHLGARVIGIHRGDPVGPTPAAQLADILINSHDPDLGYVLRTHNAGRGADVVLNAAGGPVFRIGLSLLAPRGRQVEITSPTERRVTFDLVDFYHNESQLFGVDTLKRDLTASGRILKELRSGFDSGVYQPPIVSKTIPLAHAQQAYELVAKGERGRVVLKPR
ncbi:quinone oxidoreductase family protein [Acidicapsa acidisoli]|uniref:quinone oxidoreductase family protein n=1 Tax=Acidicapsa acidisoli TaxID=1615681 RepID=UPI0021E0CAE7|nr:zinc-binding alcohol dehydrogenase family protein [Acidicapsa acidisoli]